ncbi:hypothetical protein BH11PLA2_BH11PLA2_36420 [soil metagenome]
MAISITSREAIAKDKSGSVYTLTNGPSVIEVWPFMGFNALKWSHDGTPVFYTSPEWETNPVPTRSGHPILFPFPNRLKGGKLTFEGREYQLPLNDSSGPNAIHGFTPRNAWRVIDSGVTADSAFITGEFQISKDLPGAIWPADARIRLTYHLFETSLKVDAVIDAADGKAMPFGLGYHPYFTLPGSPLSEWQLQASAATLWEAESNLPSGKQLPLPASLDFQSQRVIGDVTLDTLYGKVTRSKMNEISRIANEKATLTVHADESFRELLLFTPPHRQAVAIEPYTCTTDAANLDVRGVDAGWRVLAAGGSFACQVEYRYVRKG